MKRRLFFLLLAAGCVITSPYDIRHAFAQAKGPYPLCPSNTQCSTTSYTCCTNDIASANHIPVTFFNDPNCIGPSITEYQLPFNQGVSNNYLPNGSITLPFGVKGSATQTYGPNCTTACCSGTCCPNVGDVCDSSGNCCTPNCASATCGALDGCGGICTSGCPAGEYCDSTQKACVQCPTCEYYGCHTDTKDMAQDFGPNCPGTCDPTCNGTCSGQQCLGCIQNCENSGCQTAPYTACGQSCPANCSSTCSTTNICSGTCTPATCAGTCVNGQCCIPNCPCSTNPTTDGCGGNCPVCSGTCSGNQCITSTTCTPLCSATYVCGNDGCGGNCGTCSTGYYCDGNGACQPDGCSQVILCGGIFLAQGQNNQTYCLSDCKTAVTCQNGSYQNNGATCGNTCPCASGSQCGPDGCGGSCGSCPSNQFCQDSGGGVYECGSLNCPPIETCGGGTMTTGTGGQMICGSDCATQYICGIVQGSWPGWLSDGACPISSDPACAGKQCGSDGIGGSCGSCLSQTCNQSSGQCYTPSCGNTCGGPDGGGGTCTCGWNQICLSGQCCTLDCSGRQCGSDGCGGSCGGCPNGQYCNNGTCYNNPVGGCIPNPNAGCQTTSYTDSCGNTYPANCSGTCSGNTCTVGSTTACEPSCPCSTTGGGSDGCTSTPCPATCNGTCVNGQCQTSTCIPQCQCTTQSNVSDGCEGTCPVCKGTCEGQLCYT